MVRSTNFGDDKDRVLVKADGAYTYFASDVAYHWNKYERVDHVIDVWGADHHGYIARVRAATDALGYEGKFEVLLGQLVNLLRGGHPVKMSKRKGTMVPLRELLDEVGADATRFTLVSKSSNQMIDFDIEAAKRQDNSNPVYYVQYAHARICSILRRAAGVTADQAAQLGMDEVASRAVPSTATCRCSPTPPRPPLPVNWASSASSSKAAPVTARVPPDALRPGARGRLPRLLHRLPGALERGPSGRPGAVPGPSRRLRRHPSRACAHPLAHRRLGARAHVAFIHNHPDGPRRVQLRGPSMRKRILLIP